MSGGCRFCGRAHLQELAPPAPRPWPVRLRIALAMTAAVVGVLAGAVDALVSAVLGVRPLGVRVRRWRFRIAAAYERAAHQDVIDAEVIDDEGAVR